MGGTKGSHIVVDHPELLEATNGRELFFENDDGRIVLIYPLKGRVLVGTTDLEPTCASPSAARRRRSTTSSTSSRTSSPASPSTARTSSTASRACARFRGTTTRSRLRLARLPHRGDRARQRRSGSAAQPGRRQVDDLPRPRRAPERPGAREARTQPHDEHRGARDRWRSRVSDDGCRPHGVAREPWRAGRSCPRRRVARALRNTRRVAHRRTRRERDRRAAGIALRATAWARSPPSPARSRSCTSSTC